MTRLFVNVDHVATVREARKTVIPDPLVAALLAEEAGAHGITVHLREDRRHIQDDDVWRIRRAIRTPLNLEMAAVEEMVRLAAELVPHQVSLVPEKRQEITTEGGLDVIAQVEPLKKIKQRLSPLGIRFSLFVDADEAQLVAAVRVGADSIEINTGMYSEMNDAEGREGERLKIAHAAGFAHDLGLKVFAGHGLNLDNVRPVAAIPEIEELNIGHSLVARSILVGFRVAVSEMLEAIESIDK